MAKKEAMGWVGRLPSGETTHSKDVYTKAWMAFAAPLSGVLKTGKLKAPILSFDPGVMYEFERRGVQFDTDVIEALNKVLGKVKKGVEE